MPVSQCENLKNPNNNDNDKNKKTILDLANNDNLNGQFFFIKEQNQEHWSWWVFPSITGNKNYKQFHFDDDAQIYKSIANNQQYLNAYTKVLGYITEEIKKTPFDVGYHIDFPKAMHCYYRIYLQTQHSLTATEFNKQFLEFSKAITNNKNDILSGLQANSSKYYTQNKEKVDQICDFNILKQPTSPITNPPINPINPTPNNPPIKKPSPNTKPTTSPNEHINPIQPQQTQNNTQTNNTNQQQPLQCFYNPTLYYPQTNYPKTTYYYKQYHPTQTQTSYPTTTTTTTTKTNPVKWYDVLLCILLPVIWWIVVAQKINNQKPKQNLTTTYTTNNKTL